MCLLKYAILICFITKMLQSYEIYPKVGAKILKKCPKV